MHHLSTKSFSSQTIQNILYKSLYQFKDKSSSIKKHLLNSFSKNPAFLIYLKLPLITIKDSYFYKTPKCHF
jgi:hypothetical protein